MSRLEAIAWSGQAPALPAAWRVSRRIDRAIVRELTRRAVRCGAIVLQLRHPSELFAVAAWRPGDLRPTGDQVVRAFAGARRELRRRRAARRRRSRRR